ncbi:hypothetical protein [Acetobacterium tundrae]|uniref:CpXC domain-containing protein n=1 Tax=Acetobacterium tundrae TaxID=132932 RepID=A0ABR6WPB2_9FIRM|nr:hypothetical protein [Acetobacterium tundrae]MBC3797952.1 hypothetical protein [Acetobacterium tundrae]
MIPIICPKCGSENIIINFDPKALYNDVSQKSKNQEDTSLLTNPFYHCNHCKKNFGRDYRHLEKSTIRIDVNTYKTGTVSQTITFYKTTSGATFEGPFQCYYPELPELYFNQEDCSRFLKDFYKLNVIDWELDYGEVGSSHAFGWDLTIKFRDLQTFQSKGNDFYPPYWNGLMDLFVSFGLPNIMNELGQNFL